MLTAPGQACLIVLKSFWFWLGQVRYCNGKTKGLIFHIDGKILPYMKIQRAHNKAFSSAFLPYTGTHVMRHGGCRRVFNDTKGDRRIAGELLGNVSSSSVEVYAKAYSNLLTQLVEDEWKRYESDCN